MALQHPISTYYQVNPWFSCWTSDDTCSLKEEVGRLRTQKQNIQQLVQRELDNGGWRLGPVASRLRASMLGQESSNSRNQEPPGKLAPDPLTPPTQKVPGSTEAKVSLQKWKTSPYLLVQHSIEVIFCLNKSTCPFVSCSRDILRNFFFFFFFTIWLKIIPVTMWNVHSDNLEATDYEMFKKVCLLISKWHTSSQTLQSMNSYGSMMSNSPCTWFIIRTQS